MLCAVGEEERIIDAKESEDEDEDRLPLERERSSSVTAKDVTLARGIEFGLAL